MIFDSRNNRFKQMWKEKGFDEKFKEKNWSTHDHDEAGEASINKKTSTANLCPTISVATSVSTMIENKQDENIFLDETTSYNDLTLKSKKKKFFFRLFKCFFK